MFIIHKKNPYSIFVYFYQSKGIKIDVYIYIYIWTVIKNKILSIRLELQLFTRLLFQLSATFFFKLIVSNTNAKRK